MDNYNKYHEIDKPLVESTRPPMYTAMKYWGKKPHNIWNEYIKTYTLDEGVVLDPFSGSAIAAFEAVKNGKKGIAFDLNPLTSFIIEVYSTHFEKKLFNKTVDKIVQTVETDPAYKIFFSEKCNNCGYNDAILQHSKWNQDNIYEIGIYCPNCKTKHLSSSTENQQRLIKKIDSIEINKYVPEDSFHDSPSFSECFIKNIGGSKF